MYVVYTGNKFGAWYLNGISQVIDPNCAFSFADANGNPYTFGNG
jgi:hypothetical protein